MKKKQPKLIRLEDLPRCPSCRRRKFVGQVQSVVEKKYRTNTTYSCCKAYFCSECLVEWGEDGIVREPMYA